MLYLRLFLCFVVLYFAKALWADSRLYITVIDHSNNSYALELRGIFFIESNLNCLVSVCSDKKQIKPFKNSMPVKKYFTIKTEESEYNSHKTYLIK